MKQLQYSEEARFLGVTFDSELSFENHILDIVKRSKKRLNLLKALKGKTWGADPNTILYTYKAFIRPILEYSCVLFAHVNQKLLNKIQAIETEAIKIAHNLAPWTSNYWCYTLINFTPILERLKNLAKKFLDKNKKDELIGDLLNSSKSSNLGHHGPVYKAVNW